MKAMKAIKVMKAAKKTAAAPAPKAMKAACFVLFRNRSECIKGVRMIPGGVAENMRMSESQETRGI